MEEPTVLAFLANVTDLVRREACQVVVYTASSFVIKIPADPGPIEVAVGRDPFCKDGLWHVYITHPSGEYRYYNEVLERAVGPRRFFEGFDLEEVPGMTKKVYGLMEAVAPYILQHEESLQRERSRDDKRFFGKIMTTIS